MKKSTLTTLGLAAMALLIIASMAFAGSNCPSTCSAAKAKTTAATTTAAEGETVMLNVSNMTCGACVKHVTKSLASVSGVNDVKVNLEKGTAEVVYDAAKIKPVELTKVVTKAGYPTKLAVATNVNATAKAAHNCSASCAKNKDKCDPTACGMKTADAGKDDSK